MYTERLLLTQSSPCETKTMARPMMKFTVQIIAIIFALALSCVADAEQSRLEIARAISTETDLHLLTDTSFGGGRHYRVGDSEFFVAHLHPTSGVVTNELYIFRLDGVELRLIGFVPGRFMTEYIVEYSDGRLQVYGRKVGEDEAKWLSSFGASSSEN